MTTFHYRALKKESGQTIDGSMEAADKLSVARSLQDSGHLPLKISTETESGVSRQLLKGQMRRRAELTDREQMVFAEELSTLLDAGLDLSSSIKLMLDLFEKASVKRVMEKLLERIQEGDSLAQAMERESDFSPTLISMIRAGEVGGTVDQSLRQIAIYLGKTISVKERTRSALIYPTLMILMMAGSLAILFGMVLPQFETLFNEAGEALPLMTKILLYLSDFFQVYGKVVLLFILSLGLILKIVLQRPAMIQRWHRYLFQHMIVGDLIVKYEVARFSRIFGILLGNGVETIRAISLASQAVENMAFLRDLQEVSIKVSEGQIFSSVLEEKAIFPARALKLIRIGEETGKLAEMLEKVAEIYDHEVEKKMERMMSLLTPIITVSMGLLVGFIVVSIVTTVLSVNMMAF